MSFAQDVLKGRVQARDEAARSRASEASRANLERYNAEQLRRKIEAERAELERREAALRREPKCGGSCCSFRFRSALSRAYSRGLRRELGCWGRSLPSATADSSCWSEP